MYFWRQQIRLCLQCYHPPLSTLHHPAVARNMKQAMMTQQRHDGPGVGEQWQRGWGWAQWQPVPKNGMFFHIYFTLMILPPVPATSTNLSCLQCKTEEVSPISCSHRGRFWPTPLLCFKWGRAFCATPPSCICSGGGVVGQKALPRLKCERKGSSGQLSPFPVTFQAGQGFSPPLPSAAFPPLEHQWPTRLGMSLVFDGYYPSTSICGSPEACPSGHVLGVWQLSLPLPPLKQQQHTHLDMLLMFIA